MKRLIKIEFNKIRYHKASLRLIICYFLLFPILLLFSSMELNFGGLSTTFKELKVMEFPLIWHFGTYIVLYLKFLLLIVVVSSITGEYSHNTLKQNLIDGLSKKEFLISKVYMLILLSLLSVVIAFLTFLFIGLKNSEILDVSLIFSELDYFLGYFVRLVGFLIFGVFVAILFRRSALSIGFMFIWWISEGIIKVALTKSLGEIGSKISSFLPFQSLNNTVSEPFHRIQFVQVVSEQLGRDIDFAHGVHYLPMLISIFWSIILFFMSYRVLERRDL